MAAGRNVRQAQNRNGLIDARVGVQLGAPTVRYRHKRFFGGPLPLPARNVAPPTAIAAQRILLQSELVQRQLALVNAVAGPGTVR